MPTLNWIGKEAVAEHHRHVPSRLLECDAKLSAGDPEAENLLVEGDNLEALKALLPRYRGQVKCIYIDPPYNTGNEGWVYNDSVNDPRITKWLGQAVGKEAEDLCRHDKWLCMMHPRLSLLREFLTADGIIFVSINTHEFSRLQLLLDEIFGPQCFVGTLVWKSRHFVDARPKTGISEDHEYVFVYGRSPGCRLRGKEKDYEKYTNSDNDSRGPWTSCSLRGKATADQRPNLHYDFLDPVTGDLYPCPDRTGWICAKDTMEFYARDKRLLYPKKEGGALRQKVFKSELKSPFMGFPSVMTEYSTSDGTTEVRELLGDQVFSFPKPSHFVATLIEQATDSDSIVLDSFAGSGTTGHATLLLNEADGGNRKFVLVELDPEIASGITGARMRAVIDGGQGYHPKKETVFESKLTPSALKSAEKILKKIDDTEKTLSESFTKFERELKENHIRLIGVRDETQQRRGLGSGFRYCRLGRTLLDENGNINGDIPFTDLARYVFLLEAGVPIPKRPRKDCPLLGVHRQRAIYLLYNGVLGDRRPQGGNVLTRSVLESLPSHPDGNGVRVIFGEACRLSDSTLQKESIVFRQVPYALKEA